MTFATCAICSTRTERRELPSGAVASDVKKTVSYWCPQCRQWQATDEVATDAPSFLELTVEAATTVPTTG